MLSIKEERALVYKGEAAVYGRMRSTVIPQSLQITEEKILWSLGEELLCAVGRGSMALDTCGRSSVRQPVCPCCRSVVPLFPAFP